MGEESTAGGTTIAGDVLLHAALTTMPYGFSIWDDELKLVLWNDKYLAMYNFAPSQVYVGMSLLEMVTLTAGIGNHAGMTVDELHALYLHRFSDQGDGLAVHRYRKAIVGRVIQSTHTRSAGHWVVTHEDITEEVELQRLAAVRAEALAQQNMRFDAAVNNMPQGLAMFGADHRLVICNDMFASMYDLPRELVVRGVTLAEILQYRREKGLVPDGEQGAAYIEKRLSVASEGTRTVRFIEHERGRIFSVTHQPMADGGWVSTHQDITEQRQRDELIRARTQELEIQNVRFDAAINNMLHGLSMFDAENRLIVCNRQYAELYGLPPHLTRPGTPLWEMLDDGERTGMVSVKDRSTRFTALSAVIDAAQPFKDNFKMENGRVIAVLHQPMAGGGWISTHEDVTEQHHNEEHIRHLARHDSLTDLPNRVLFREEMEKLEARLKRQEGVAVLCVDLDHFKAVNDTRGHAAGDGVLITVAKRLREVSRETDVVARLGGDEFAVLVGPLEDPKYAVRIADRIVKSIAAPMLIEGSQVVIGASVGIAMAPVDGTDAETLLKNADLALYRAKSEGRGTYHFFEKSMDDALKLRRAMELRLKAALAQGEFRLMFQPLVGLSDNKIGCLEALLRWDDPERGLVPPADFIPLAEDTGMIVEIGEWVLREACKAAARWPTPIRIAVNLSAAQVRHRGLVGCVESALAEAGLAADRLELDVTEQLLASDGDAIFKTLHRLRAIGVRIAIDDFGSGYASLGHLRSFPFDKVKIDRMFMSRFAGQDDPMAVVNAMISLGQSLGVETSAEGIETEAQLEAIRRHGCNEVQGFLFSPPLPASGVDALLGTLRANDARRRGAAG